MFCSCFVVAIWLLMCVWLFLGPMDCSPPGSSDHRISQVRILEWVVISFSRGSSQPRDWTHDSHIGRQVLYQGATREAHRLKILISIHAYLWKGMVLVIENIVWMFIFAICKAKKKRKLILWCDLLLLLVTRSFRKTKTTG